MHPASALAAGTNNKGAVTMPAQPGLALTHGMQVPHRHWPAQGRWRFIKATCMSGEAGARPRTARSLASPPPQHSASRALTLRAAILYLAQLCTMLLVLPGRPRAFLRSTTVCWDCPGQRARRWCGHATEHDLHSSRGCSFNCACRPRPLHPYAGARWHRQVSTTMPGLSIVDCDASDMVASNCPYSTLLRLEESVWRGNKLCPSRRLSAPMPVVRSGRVLSAVPSCHCRCRQTSECLGNLRRLWMHTRDVQASPQDSCRCQKFPSFVASSAVSRRPWLACGCCVSHPCHVHRPLPDPDLGSIPMHAGQVELHRPLDAPRYA